MNLYNNFIETKFLDFLNRYLDVPLKKKGYQVLSVNISQPVIEPSQALEKGLIYEYIIEVNYQSPSGIDLKMNLGIPKLNTGLFIIFGKHKTPTLRLISEDRIRFEPDLFVIDYNRSYCYSTNKIKYIDSTGTETIVELDSMDELPIEFSKLDDYLVKKLSIKMEKDFNLILTKDDLFTIKDKFIGVHDRDWDHILDKKVQTIQSALVSTFNSSKKEIYTRITGDLNRRGKLYPSSINKVVKRFFNVGNMIDNPTKVNSLTFLSQSNRIKLSPFTEYNRTLVDIIDPIRTPENAKANISNELNVCAVIGPDGDINMRCYDKNLNKIVLPYIDYFDSNIIDNQSYDYILNKFKDENNIIVRRRGNIIGSFNKSNLPKDYIIDAKADEKLSPSTRNVPMINHTDSIRVAMG
jgi:hypothetical protein